MWSGIYYIIVIVVAVWAVLTGYRKGLLRQMPGVLGMAFGIVAAGMLGPECYDVVDGWLPASVSGFRRPFVIQTLCCGIIYLVVAAVVGFCAIPLGALVGRLGWGVLDSIGGAVFRTLQYLIVLSIFYNLLVDINPAGELTRSSSRHDGNIVEGVMKIAPSLMGFPDAEEVAYRQQLEDAKKIS